MNEYVIVDVHLAEVSKQIVQVLAIHVLLLTSNCGNSHVHKVQACACWEHTHCKVEAPILNHAQFLTVKIFQYKICTFQYILGVVSSIIDYWTSALFGSQNSQ